MPRSIIGTNVALDHVTNYPELVSLHRATNPTVMVAMVDAMKDAEKIRQLQRDLPGVQIIARVWHDLEGGYAQPPTGKDDTRTMIATPEDVLGQQVELGRNGLWLHVMNEPSAFMAPAEVRRTVDWLVQFITLAAAQNCACVLGNLADMHPPIVDGQWDQTWWPFLRKLAEFPKLVRLGLHNYGPDKSTDVLTALNATCKALGIKPPQVVITEFGLDSTGQGDRANGYHSRGYSGAAFLDWQREQVQGDLKPFISSGQVIGLATFQWNPLWGQFSIAADAGYKEAYKAAALRGDLDVAVVKYMPGEAPATLRGGFYYKVGYSQNSRKRNLRGLPDETSEDRGDVANDDIIRLYDSPQEYDQPLNRRWQWCVLMKDGEDSASGWLWTDGIKLTPVTKPEKPVEIPTPKPEPVIPVPVITKPMMLMMTPVQRERIIGHLLGIVTELQSLEEATEVTANEQPA